ncbi:MAG: hypothetical protein K9J13_14720 [Saprospiraceae bacterium]|nr:hypothetical protein [Saprospiraceae bacterium]
MRKYSILILILVFNVCHSYSQEFAIFYINEETDYPYRKFTKEAKKQYTWVINGTEIKYKTGRYKIPVNSSHAFDTIYFKNILSKDDVIFTDGRVIYDTLKIQILCKLKANHNYSLSQIFPGNFEIYSLDSLCVEKSIIFKTINKQNSDTLYFFFNEYNKIFSDTILNLSTSNNKLRESFVNDFALYRNSLFSRFFESKNNTKLYSLSFLYLHSETLEIIYDFKTNKYKLKIVDK